MNMMRYLDLVQDFDYLSDEELKKAIEEEEKRCEELNEWPPIE